jgi:hypothetical protein
MRRELAKQLLDEEVICVERVIGALFEVGKTYRIEVRNGVGLSSYVGRVSYIDRTTVTIKTDSQLEKIIPFREIVYIWEV